MTPLGMIGKLAKLAKENAKLVRRTTGMMSLISLGTVLWHKNKEFSDQKLRLVISLIKSGDISVFINKPAMTRLNHNALYFSSDVMSKKGETLMHGNSLYLSDHPERLSPGTLAHEAVHMYFDYLGKKEFLWDNEELAFFVEGFVEAKLTPKLVKTYARSDNNWLIGSLALDYYNENPNIGEIKSEEFNRRISYDFTKEGGVKGKANPYKSLEKMVRKHYPLGRVNGKKTYNSFDGIK